MVELDALIIKISNNIMNYQEGDIMLQAELIDQLKELGAKFKEDFQINNLTDYMVDTIQNIMKENSSVDPVRLLTDGIDIIQKYYGLDENSSKEYIYQKIHELVEATGQTDTNASIKIQNEKPGLIQIVASDVVNNFIVEAVEKIEKAQEIILELENDTENTDKIHELFRIFHTIKGECGFLKIASLGELSHNLENLFDLVKSGRLQINSHIIDILLNGIDLAKEILSQLKRGDAVLFNYVQMEAYFNEIERIVRPVKETIGKVLPDKNILNEKDIQDCLKNQNSPQDKEPEKKVVSQNESVLKVKASKINYIVDMIGELLIAEGQINDSSYLYNQIRKITKNLQYAAMQLRTEKIKNLFINAKRVVRDLVKKLDKPIDMELKGEELEIDRNLIENLEEPLMHLIRNSISHGIEPVEERKKLNKPPEGKITLNAERRGNNIVLSIRDDGAGLNKEKIIRKALEKNLLKPESIQNHSESEIHNLIFLPGFSTADNVDQVSGRGVGMDIVNTVVTSLRGKIEIQTEQGHYTQFNLIFPLNTAIIDGMIVRVADNLMVMPVSSIVSLMKLKNPEIHKVNDKVDVINFRDEPIPIIDIKKFFNMGTTDLTNTSGVVVENIDRKKFLLTVDEILSKKEVVIKSIGKKFEKLRGISSGTVLTGGKIGLVMDIDLILEHHKQEE